MMASVYNALQKYAKKNISLPKAPRFLLKLTLLPRVAFASSAQVSTIIARCEQYSRFEWGVILATLGVIFATLGEILGTLAA